MKIRIRTVLPALYVTLEGELDHHAAGGIRTAVDGHLADRRIDTLYIDLKGVDFMDSAGIGVLLGRYKLMHARGGNVYILQVSPAADRILRMGAVYERIPIVSGGRRQEVIHGNRA